MQKNKAKYDKFNETDKQMLIRVSKKFAYLFFVIFMFDTLIDWFLTALDFAGHLFHYIVEFFEYSFELVLEHVFDSSHHQSEVIIVNLVLILFIYVIYRILRQIPHHTVTLTNAIKRHWQHYKHSESIYWHALPLNRKIKLCFVYFIGFSALFFILTL